MADSLSLKPLARQKGFLALLIVVLLAGLLISIGQFEGRLWSFSAIKIAVCGLGLMLVALQQKVWLRLAQVYLILLLIGNSILLLQTIWQFILGDLAWGAWLRFGITALEWGAAYLLFRYSLTARLMPEQAPQ